MTHQAVQLSSPARAARSSGPSVVALSATTADGLWRSQDYAPGRPPPNRASTTIMGRPPPSPRRTAQDHEIGVGYARHGPDRAERISELRLPRTLRSDRAWHSGRPGFLGPSWPRR